MAEEEWLKTVNPSRLIDIVHAEVSPVPRRKLWLYFGACGRRLPRSVLWGCFLEAIEAIERLADGEISLRTFNHVRSVLKYGDNPNGWRRDWFRHLFASTARIWDSAKAIGNLCDGFRTEVHPGTHFWDELVEQGIPVKPRDRAELADMLRDIFGNPFRQVSFNPAWRTDTAVAVARQMYDSRDFGAMPILADALQDAGCEDEQVLNHCREPGPHVRGCWVCDLVLGL